MFQARFGPADGLEKIFFLRYQRGAYSVENCDRLRKAMIRPRINDLTQYFDVSNGA